MKKSVIIFVLLSLLPEVCFAADMLPDSVAYRAGKWFLYVPYAHLLYADEHPEYFREAAADPRCFCGCTIQYAALCRIFFARRYGSACVLRQLSVRHVPQYRQFLSCRYLRGVSVISCQPAKKEGTLI